MAMPQRQRDEELAALVETRLRTALLCDAMDERGLLNQAMAEWIRPLAPKVDQVIAGKSGTRLRRILARLQGPPPGA